MERTILRVDGMSCEHCVKAVTGAAKGLPGVAGAVVDLGAGTVTLDYDPAQTPLDRIRAEIEDQGYDVGPIVTR
ncbi:MAG: cation transporter [Oscillospiraceae bacterium]|jgi:copper chaperone|nr:cation transporter [Oscillospiraceae bacterium]